MFIYKLHTTYVQSKTKSIQLYLVNTVIKQKLFIFRNTCRLKARFAVKRPNINTGILEAGQI